MKRFHRAIRPADNEGEFFIYNIEYIKDGLSVEIVDATIHLVVDGIVGNNILPPETVPDHSTDLALFNLLVVDNVLKADPEEDN